MPPPSCAPPNRAMTVKTWYWVKECPWGTCKDLKFSCGKLAWSKVDKNSETPEGLKEKLLDHSKGSGCHWDAPDEMKRMIVERAMRKKLCYADFDSDDNMVPGTEMLADSSSGEDSGDEAYTQMMLSRRKTGSPTNVRSPKRRERNETKKKTKRRQSSSPSRKGFRAEGSRKKARGSALIGSMLDECLHAAEDAEAKAADAQAAASFFKEKLEDLAAKLGDTM